MEYIILNKPPTIDGVEHTNFLYVLDLNESNISVNVANSEYTFTVPITSDNPEIDVNNFFANL